MPHFCIKRQIFRLIGTFYKKANQIGPKEPQSQEFSIHYLSFKPNLTNILKYLVPKDVRQNSIIRPCLGLKSREYSKFCRTGLNSIYVFKLTLQIRLKWCIILERNSGDWGYFSYRIDAIYTSPWIVRVGAASGLF